MSYKKRKWNPTPEELEQYKKKVEEAKELSKSAIKDIFKNYKIDDNKIVEYLKFSSKFYRYSPYNTAMIMSQLPHAVYVQSRQAWKKMDAHPVKGSVGAVILVPKPLVYIRTDVDTLKRINAYDEIKKYAKANKKTVSIRYTEASKELQEMADKGLLPKEHIMQYGRGSVFDISQTNYPKEKYPEIFNMGIDDDKANFMFNAITSFVTEKTKFSIELDDVESISLRGYFSPLENKIVISDKLNDSERIKTTLHELGHAFYHNAELYNPSNDYSTAEESKLEIEADTFAVLALSMYDFEIPKSLCDHLSGYYKILSKEYEKDGLTEEQIQEEIKGVTVKIINDFNKYAKDISEYIQEYSLETATKIEQTNETEETDEIDMSF